jgi:hypothetical protein
MEVSGIPRSHLPESGILSSRYRMGTTPRSNYRKKVMNTPRRLEQRELELIQKLANCQLAMTPREFEAKWDVTRLQMAALCNCSVGSVKRWFKLGRDYTAPNQYHLLYLALADLLLEYYDRLPAELSIVTNRGR